MHLIRFARIMVVQEYFVTPGSSLVSFRNLTKEEKLSKKSKLQRVLIVMLLMISGNVQPNPGPDVVTSFNTLADFKSRTGLGIVHLNVHSLLTKLDMLRIIRIVSYNVYRADRSNRGGGVAAFIQNKYITNVLFI